jgi:hypothetical protein
MRRKDKRVGASAATVVSGNEAEELPLYGPAEQPAPTAAAEESKPSASVVQLPEKAANDDVVERPPVVEEQTTEASASATLTAEELAGQYGWTLYEAIEILGTEHSIRNDHCKRKHNGVSYDEMRMKRFYAKEGVVGNRYYKSEHSKFAQFWNKTADIPRVPECMNVKLLMRRGDSKYAYMRGMAETPKAYRKREQRRRLHLKVAIKERQGSAAFQRELRFAEVNALAHEPIVPRNWAAKRRAMATRWSDRWDTVRGWFGRPPRDRLSDTQKELIAETQPDRESSQAELVRRYQRQGISH